MKPKVELKKIRDFGEIIDDSILFFKQNWKALFNAYFVICGFFWIAGLIISIFNQIQTYQRIEDGLSAFGTTYFLTLFFEIITYTMISLTALSFITLYQEKGNEAPDVEEVWSYVKFYFFRIISSSILLVIGLVLGTLFCIIPGVYLYPVFSLILTIMVIENTTLGYAFNHSFQLIKNNWWQTFGVLIVISIIVAAAMLLFLIPVMFIVAGVLFISGINAGHIYAIASGVTVHLLQFLYVLPFISIALVYYSLTEQKEDGSLMNRIQMLGKNNSDTQQLPSEEY